MTITRWTHGRGVAHQIGDEPVDPRLDDAVVVVEHDDDSFVEFVEFVGQLGDQRVVGGERFGRRHL